LGLSAADDGALTLETKEDGLKPVRLKVGPGDVLELTAGGLSLSYDGVKAVLSVDDVSLEIGPAVRLAMPKTTLVADDQRVSLASVLPLELQIPRLRIVADSVDVESQDVRLGRGTREVAFKGAQTEPHTHQVRFTAGGYPYDVTTDAAAPEIAEGADEVKV
jgi:hypothetical protein